MSHTPQGEAASELPASVRIQRLSLHRPLIPLIADWFKKEWPDWYGPGGAGDADADLRRYAQDDALIPLGLVALCDGQPCGFGALKQQGIGSDPTRGPWAGAGYVLPALRGRGLGALLLRALVGEAQALGFERVYCVTGTAQSLLQREGWQVLEVTQQGEQRLTVFGSPR